MTPRLLHSMRLPSRCTCPACMLEAGMKHGQHLALETLLLLEALIGHELDSHWSGTVQHGLVHHTKAPAAGATRVRRCVTALSFLSATAWAC